MSGGSYSYICFRLEEECAGQMYDEELNDLIKDLCEVLHDLEWWQSGDTSEDKYRKTVDAFKEKWFLGKREERLKGYIDDRFKRMRHEMYTLIGLEEGESHDD